MRMPALRYRYSRATITHSIAIRPTRSQRTPVWARRARAAPAPPRGFGGRARRGAERGREAEAAGMLPPHSPPPAKLLPRPPRSWPGVLAAAKGAPPGALGVRPQLLL